MHHSVFAILISKMLQLGEANGAGRGPMAAASKKSGSCS